ncbi:MAG: FmdB family zinc ribbon protein [Pseudomarimonas sp.]
MPIYGYQCAACGHTYDRLQKLSEADPTHCPVCASESLKRQLTAPAFRLSGSGWYETDFKKDSDKKRNLSDSGEGGKSDSAGDSKSESKPDAKADAKPEAKPATATESKPAAAPTPTPSSSPSSSTP